MDRFERFHQKRKALGLCRRCGSKNDTDGINCTSCRLKIKDQKKQRELQLKSERLCPRCGEPARPDGIMCIGCLDNRKSNNLKLKQKVIDAYGGECACCHDDFIGRLTIDHKNNDGAEHRRSIGSKGGSSFYHYLVVNNFPEGYQVLCASCNLSKFTMGYCPHKKKE